MSRDVKPGQEDEQPSGGRPMVTMQPTFETEWPGASALAAECVLNVYVLASLIESRSVEWVRERGIPSLSAFNVLTILDGAGEPLQPSAISEQMMVARGTMTGILRTLEAHRFVQRRRHGRDGRARMISLTRRGRKVVDELMPRVHAAETQLMGCLTADEQQRLLNLVVRVQSATAELSLPRAGLVQRHRSHQGPTGRRVRIGAGRGPWAHRQHCRDETDRPPPNGLQPTGRRSGRVGRVKTLHPAYRVTDLAVSLDFYTALGYGEVGRIEIGDGASLTVLKLPGEKVASLELVHRPTDEPVEIGTGFSHLAVQVDDLAATVESLAQSGLRPGPVERPGGPDGPQTSWITDPDGYRIELVQWPAGHPDGLTAADFG